jgi:hypothetical protein
VRDTFRRESVRGPITGGADDSPRWPALAISDRIVWVDVEADVDSDLVLFNSEADTYHSLDPTAGFVWRSIANGDAMGKIVNTLNRRYDGDRAIVRDIRVFVEQAVTLGLLTVLEPAE